MSCTKRFFSLTLSFDLVAPHPFLHVSASNNSSAQTLTSKTPQAAHEQIIKNLQRENAMISTAWYDLTSRLQSNHVVLQRKDQPKSWLNKQRQLVNCEFYQCPFYHRPSAC